MRPDLTKALFAYDSALRIYRNAWGKAAAPIPAQRDEISKLLTSVEAIAEKYGDGFLNRLFNRVFGVS